MVKKQLWIVENVTSGLKSNIFYENRNAARREHPFTLKKYWEDIFEVENIMRTSSSLDGKVTFTDGKVG